MRGLPLPAQAYAGAIIALAGSIVATSSLTGICWPRVAVLAALFIVTESCSTTLTQRTCVSMAFASGLAAVVLAGPIGAAVIGVTAMLAPRRNVAVIKRLFNGAQYAISGYTAGSVFQVAGGHPYRLGETDWTRHVIGPFTAALVTYVTVNLLLMSAALLISRQGTCREVVSAGRLVVPACLGFGMIGLLIAGTWPAVGPFAAVLVFTPLLIAQWAFTQINAQEKAQAATIAALCQAVETKDYYTRGHSERVSRGAAMAGRQVGMRPDRLKAIRYAGMLHDVGKLGVPTEVLQKPGKPTEDEFAALQLHPMRGLQIVNDIGFLDEALAGIMHHHERVDGLGYPMGLAGTEIPEFARIIAVADAFDCMTSTRSYRAARPVEEAIAELRRCAGTHFDREAVEAFIAAVERENWAPANLVRVPADAGARAGSQDHDDPSAPIQVTGS